MPAQQFEVKAKENSVSGGTPLDTGILFTPGDWIKITVKEDDTWCCGLSDMTSNANGLVAGNKFGGVYGSMMSPTSGIAFPYGSLVGSLDGGKNYFLVGTNFKQPALRRGNLTLVYWDANGEDNTGSVIASVERIPGPVSYIVQANENSVSGGVACKTRIVVEKGDFMTINTRDDYKWSNSPDLAGACTANGKSDEPKEVKGQTFPLASLVGSLDDGKTFFFIGTGFQKTMTESGPLTLYFWDTDTGNNSGFVFPVINIVKPS